MKKYNIEITETHRQYLLGLIVADIKRMEKKEYPIPPEVEEIDMKLLNAK